jgi:hypothetical protein
VFLIRGCRGVLVAAGLLATATGAPAQMAVFDASSVAQLIHQATMLAQQLAAARAQLEQIQAQYQAMTGTRGMQALLAGTVRNYLPTGWTELSTLLAGGASAGALGAAFESDLRANAVLSDAQIAALPADGRAQILASRRTVAMLQTLSRDALGNASGRFAAIQQLINAIAGAGDQKGILDLQARIGAEQSMLQNEQTKLQVLYQIAIAESWANQEHEREQVIAAQGQFVGRFEPTPQ